MRLLLLALLMAACSPALAPPSATDCSDAALAKLEAACMADSAPGLAACKLRGDTYANCPERIAADERCEEYETVWINCKP